MVKPKRYYLAKSADTGKCGNKSGTPPRVGVSLTTLRIFKGAPGACCKSNAIAGCTGPQNRTRQ